jgi:hypothetical protein
MGIVTDRFRQLTLLTACWVPLAAQWLTYPTAGVPRTRTGEPDLTALAPRQGGKPDLSGIWVASNTQFSCPAGICVLQMNLPVEARNIGTTVSGGLPYNAATVELMKQRTIEASRNDPHARCTPPNFPRAFALPQYKKIVQTPGLILMLHEFNASYRQVFTDGRPLPTVVQPTWNGYSTGEWEGDTLTIQSAGFRDGLWLDMLGNPLTEAAKVTERIRRVNYGSLDVEVTIDDPRAYTKPWTVKLNQSIVLDTELLDEICTENEKSVVHLEAR